MSEAGTPPTSERPVERVDLVGAGGVRLAADVFGSHDDPPVVLLHGGGQTRFAWGTTPNMLTAVVPRSAKRRSAASTIRSRVGCAVVVIA